MLHILHDTAKTTHKYGPLQCLRAVLTLLIDFRADPINSSIDFYTLLRIFINSPFRSMKIDFYSRVETLGDLQTKLIRCASVEVVYDLPLTSVQINPDPPASFPGPIYI